MVEIAVGFVMLLVFVGISGGAVAILHFGLFANDEVNGPWRVILRVLGIALVVGLVVGISYLVGSSATAKAAVGG